LSIKVGLKEINSFIRALHCPTRWKIIEILADGAKGTGEISRELKKDSEDVSKPSLYYHLSELEEVGIIGVSNYREVGGGAPEKIWKLKTSQVIIDLIQKEKR